MLHKQMATACLLVALLAETKFDTAAGPSAKPVFKAAPANRLPGNSADFETVVAADAAGHVVVAAIGNSGSGFNTSVFLWNSADGGKSFSLPRPALPVAEPPEESRFQADPGLLYSGAGQFKLALMAKRAKEPGRNVFLSDSPDGGKTWKRSGEIDAGEFDVDRPVFAMSPNGRRAALAFSAGGDDLLRVLFSADGGASWARAPKPLAPLKQWSNPYGISIDNDGRTVVSYELGSGSLPTRLVLAVTEDQGKSWQHHEPGRPFDGQQAPDSLEEKFQVVRRFSGVAVAQDNARKIHALFAQRAEQNRDVELWYTWSQDGKIWSTPTPMANSRAVVKAYPVIVASGQRLHACWLEGEGGWCNVWYRGSVDGGVTWSDRLVLSVPEYASECLTERGFRAFSGHYFGVADDGRGTAHVVWAIAAAHAKQRGEVWHTTVRLD